MTSDNQKSMCHWRDQDHSLRTTAIENYSLHFPLLKPSPLPSLLLYKSGTEPLTGERMPV